MCELHGCWLCLESNYLFHLRTVRQYLKLSRKYVTDSNVSVMHLQYWRFGLNLFKLCITFLDNSYIFLFRMLPRLTSKSVRILVLMASELIDVDFGSHGLRGHSVDYYDHKTSLDSGNKSQRWPSWDCTSKVDETKLGERVWRWYIFLDENSAMMQECSKKKPKQLVTFSDLDSIIAVSAFKGIFTCSAQSYTHEHTHTRT